MSGRSLDDDLRKELNLLVPPMPSEGKWSKVQERVCGETLAESPGVAGGAQNQSNVASVGPASQSARTRPTEGRLISHERRRRSAFAYAVISLAVLVLLAGVGTGVFEAAKHLSGGQPILVITDETTATTETTVTSTPQTTVTSTPAQTTLPTGPAVTSTLGRNWERLPLAVEGAAVGGLVMDPSNPAVLYVTTSEGLFKSTDGAKHWTKLPVEAIWLLSRMVVDPGSPSTLYVTDPLAYRSLDGGATWTRMTSCDEIGMDPWWIDSSTSPSTLWAIRYGGGDGPNILCKSTDGGSTWEEVSRTAGDLDLWWGQPITVDPINHMLYTVRPGVGMRSFDGGVTWEDVSAGLPRMIQGEGWPSILLDPRDSSRLYLYPDSYLETLEPPVFVSTDKAQTWTELTGAELDWAKAVFLVDPATPAAAIEAAAAFLTDFDRTVTDASSGVQVSGEGGVVLDPGDPSVMYMGTSKGVYKSTDQGATWNKASFGVTDPNVFRVLVDPLSPTTIYAITVAFIAKSTDGGASWTRILPSPENQVPFDGALLLAPSLPTRLYATSPNGLLRSDDGGATWTQLAASGLLEPTEENPQVYLMLVASDQPDTVFARASRDSGSCLYRSTDGGNTWDQVTGLPDRPSRVTALVEAPDDPSRLYAGVAGEWEGPAYNGFFKSTDGGKTWAPAGDQSPWGDGILALAIDPHNPLNLYAAAYEGEANYLFAWHSTDGGETWTKVIYYDVPSWCTPEIVFDPRTPGTLYARTFGSYSAGALYRSTDGGATLQDITQERYVVFSFVIDPASSNGLYAATGQGLYKWTPNE